MKASFLNMNDNDYYWNWMGKRGVLVLYSGTPPATMAAFASDWDVKYKFQKSLSTVSSVPEPIDEATIGTHVIAAYGSTNSGDNSHALDKSLQLLMYSASNVANGWQEGRIEVYGKSTGTHVAAKTYGTGSATFGLYITEAVVPIAASPDWDGGFTEKGVILMTGINTGSSDAIEIGNGSSGENSFTTGVDAPTLKRVKFRVTMHMPANSDAGLWWENGILYDASNDFIDLSTGGVNPGLYHPFKVTGVE